MSYQLEVIKFRDLVPITSIPRFVPEFESPTIEITGDDFSSVDKVIINDLLAPEFIIINKHKLYAQLPEGALSNISRIEVVSSSFTKNMDTSRISYELGNKTRKVNGILKLVQLFTKWMLQTPGSDLFDVGWGGGLQELVGKVSSSKSMEPVMTSVIQAIDRTSSQIQTAQAKMRGIPQDEKLLSATLVDFAIQSDRMEAWARVRLLSQAGQVAVSNIGL